MYFGAMGDLKGSERRDLKDKNRAIISIGQGLLASVGLVYAIGSKLRPWI